MAHAQKPEFVLRRNGRVHLNRRGRQFSRLLKAEVCASAVVMLDTPWAEVVWSHSIRQFLLHFPSRASPCAITFHWTLPVYHPRWATDLGTNYRYPQPVPESCRNTVRFSRSTMPYRRWLCIIQNTRKWKYMARKNNILHKSQF